MGREVQHGLVLLVVDGVVPWSSNVAPAAMTVVKNCRFISKNTPLKQIARFQNPFCNILLISRPLGMPCKHVDNAMHASLRNEPSPRDPSNPAHAACYTATTPATLIHQNFNSG